MPRRLRPSLFWLLLFVPVVPLLRFLAPENHTLLFAVSCLAIIPLAGLLGRATEQLADRAGEGVGGLLNATFGNAAELIIAFMALRRGMYDVVKASLAGSIIGNILLVLGVSFVAGGVRHRVQRFHRGGVHAQSTMLTLAAIALIVPAAYHHLGGRDTFLHESGLSFEIAVILLVTYALGLFFTLRTHRHFFTGLEGGSALPNGRGESHVWSLGRSLAVLGAATALIGWISEILVGSVESAAHAMGMSGVFVGVIVVAIIGNAAEHSSAVVAARKDRMDLSLGIALGSSIQVALFVAPVLVLLSHVCGPRPMDLVFSTPEVLAVVLSVWIGAQVTSDGESNWLEGVQLLSVYSILAVVFYFLPTA